MRRLKVSTWQQVLSRLANEPEARALLVLSAERVQLLREHAFTLPYLSVDPVVTVIACTVCGEVGLHDKRPAPTKCYLTLRCAGQLVRAGTVEARRPSGDEAADGEAPVLQPAHGVQSPAAESTPSARLPAGAPSVQFGVDDLFL